MARPNGARSLDVGPFPQAEHLGRMILAEFGHSSSDMANTTFHVLGPRNAARTITNGNNGMPRAMSAMRIRTASIRPPK